MYDDMDLSQIKDPAKRHELRQFVLTAGEVARLLDVSQQAVNHWTKLDQIAHHTEPDDRSDRHYATNRYSLRGVIDRAIETNRPVHLYRAPLRLLTQYDITAATEHGDICLFTPPEGASVPEWMSESEAARVLHLSRSTLYAKRRAERLNPKVRTEVNPRNGGVMYHVDSVKEILSGKLEVFVAPPAKEKVVTADSGLSLEEARFRSQHGI